MKRKKVILFLIVIVLITTQFVIASDISDSNVDPSIYDNRPRKSTSLVDNLPLPPEELEKSPCYGCIFDETCISFRTHSCYINIHSKINLTEYLNVCISIFYICQKSMMRGPQSLPFWHLWGFLFCLNIFIWWALDV